MPGSEGLTGAGLIVDSFAGGGGASLGIEMALGRSPDIAINHDAEAVAMHAANHPGSEHYCKSVWLVDPMDAVGRRRVDLLWASPDCKHFSKAKGAAPVKREIRDLAWVVVLWARRARPRVIALENVEEFRAWGPLGLDGKPCPDRRGQTFERWTGELRRLGYRVQWRELRACDYGAPTTRKRLFLIARRDGQKIVWPEPTHGAPSSPGVRRGKLQPWRTAAECIDWSLPCHSIFLTREEGRAIGVNRPLAEATMARIARGVRRYVLEAADPFIVPITHTGDRRVHEIDEPLRTVTTAHRGELAIAVPFLSPFTQNGVGADARKPVSTITQRGTNQALVSAFMLSLKGTARQAFGVDEPTRTICASTVHQAEVRAFLLKYYGEGSQDQDCRDPLHTVPTRARFGLVTVAGEQFELVDIGMRMLSPRELFRAQGFPESYRIDPIVDGKPLTKTAQIRMCGNSVCPQVAAAIIGANMGSGTARGPQPDFEEEAA